MADKAPSRSGKRPVSQKRVAVVLASLVGTMTVSAAALLMMEGGALGTSPLGAAVTTETSIRAKVQTPRLKSEAWNYIIIYESGDLSASADSLADGLQAGGNSSPSTMRPPPPAPRANFHFVITRSGHGRMDGELEAGTSWSDQVAGAPYASWPDPRSYTFTPYNQAVGVCLAADLDREPISQAQHHTLLQVVRELQHTLNIPSDRVLFQWDPALKAMHASAAQQAYARSFRAELE